MTLVIEELDCSDAADLQEERDDLQARHNASVSCAVRRLSFFSEAFSDESELEGVREDSFIGYAIIKEDKIRGKRPRLRVYESIIPPSHHHKNFIRGAPRWRCRVGPRVFQADGYVYAQQNNATNVCAHVACRTAAARFHPNGDMSYREMNELLGIDHISTRLGSGQGISVDDMERVLEAAGARCLRGAYTITAPDINLPFQKLIYGSVESGYPAIVCFTVKSGSNLHAIPVFGHTFNEDVWVPHAELAYFQVTKSTRYVPSDWWLSSFISHDDNCGCNYCVPRFFLHSSTACVLATLPREVEGSPTRAEVSGIDYLASMLPQLPNPSEPWNRRLREYAAHDRLVLRPLLIDSSHYVSHLKRIVDWDKSPIREETIAAIGDWPRMPRGLIWMVELSVPELFSGNRRKLGEITMRADRKPARDFGNYLLARVPGYFAVHAGAPNEPKYAFISSGAQGHVPLFGCETDDPHSLEA